MPGTTVDVQVEQPGKGDVMTRFLNVFRYSERCYFAIRIKLIIVPMSMDRALNDIGLFLIVF